MLKSVFFYKGGEFYFKNMASSQLEEKEVYLPGAGTSLYYVYVLPKKDQVKMNLIHPLVPSLETKIVMPLMKIKV